MIKRVKTIRDAFEDRWQMEKLMLCWKLSHDEKLLLKILFLEVLEITGNLYIRMGSEFLS